MNIMLQELRMDRKSLISWLISLVVLTAFFMMLYPPLAADLHDFLGFINNLPPEFKNALGADNFNYGALIGFYSMILTYVLLAGSIQAMNLGVSALSRELRAQTADFVYAKPVTRSRIVGMKLAAIGLQLLMTNLVYIAAALLIIQTVRQAADPVDFSLYILLTSALAGLQAVFCAIGLLVSTLLKRVKTVLPISMGVVFFFYILFGINQTLNNTELSFLTPFSYFDLEKLLNQNGYELKYVVTALAVILAATGTAWLAFLKKDLPSL